MGDLRRRSHIIAVELCHAGHVKGTETSHNPLSVLLVLPHLRVVLRQLAVRDERCHGPFIMSVSSEATGVTLIFLTLLAALDLFVGEEVGGFAANRYQIVLI